MWRLSNKQGLLRQVFATDAEMSQVFGSEGRRYPTQLDQLHYPIF
jgi:hypothetical protein